MKVANVFCPVIFTTGDDANIGCCSESSYLRIINVCIHCEYANETKNSRSHRDFTMPSEYFTVPNSRRRRYMPAGS